MWMRPSLSNPTGQEKKAVSKNEVLKYWLGQLHVKRQLAQETCQLKFLHHVFVYLQLTTYMSLTAISKHTQSTQMT
eukprot:jgi/Chlat1/6255/Chrsp44S09047